MIKPANMPVPFNTALPSVSTEPEASGRPAAAAIWSHLPAGCVFMRWVQQLKRAVQHVNGLSPGPEAFPRVPGRSVDRDCAGVWDMVGHGVVVEHSDPEEADALLPLVAREAGMDYWEIEHDQVVSGFEDWKQLLAERVPTLVHLRAGRWISDNSVDDDKTGLHSHPDYSPAEAASFRAAFAREISIRSAGKPVVVVVAAINASHLAPELFGARRLERRVAITELDDATHGAVFIEQCAGVHFDSTVLRQPQKVGAVMRRHGLRSRLDIAQALRRLTWHEKRPASLRDLIEFDVHGTGEQDLGNVSAAVLWRVAVHEAGHALIAYLASGRQHVPAYCSVGSRRESAGLVMPSYDQIQRTERGEDTYADKLLRLRLLLAGRCAEHVVLGPAGISAGGAGSDLQKASRLAMNMLGSFGLPLGVNDDADLAGNLLVVIGHPADCEIDHYAAKARALLREQYLHVIELLRSNHALLLKLAKQLTIRRVLLEDELLLIMGSAPHASIGSSNEREGLVNAA